MIERNPPWLHVQSLKLSETSGENLQMSLPRLLFFCVDHEAVLVTWNRSKATVETISPVPMELVLFHRPKRSTISGWWFGT